MKRVLTAAVLIPLVLLAVFRAPSPVFTALVAVVALLATTEYLQIIANYSVTPYRRIALASVAFLFIAFIFLMLFEAAGATVWFVVVMLFIVSASAFLCVGLRAQDLRTVLPDASMSYFALPYVGGSLATLALLRELPGGWFYILFTFFAVWVGDTAAYYVGRSIGKTKFAARVSPKKTWEGAIASILGAVVVGCVFAWLGPELQQWLYRIGLLNPMTQRNAFGTVVRAEMWFPAVFAALINIAAQLGDLFESLIKRGAGVKDSGTMLPGHGGILDRVDALLFASPVALILFMFGGDKFVRIP